MNDVPDFFAALTAGMMPSEPEPEQRQVYTLKVPVDRVVELLTKVDASEAFNHGLTNKDHHRSIFICQEYWHVVCELHPSARWRKLRLNLNSQDGVAIEVLSHTPIEPPADSMVFAYDSPALTALRAIGFEPTIGPRVRRYLIDTEILRLTGFRRDEFHTHGFNDMMIVHKNADQFEAFKDDIEESCTPSEDLN